MAMIALATIKKEWSSITDAARDRLVIESVVGRDSWKVTPALPVLKALLGLGANPNARVASDRDHYPIRAKTSALELCTWELEHPEHVDLVLSRKEVARRNAALSAAATALVNAGASLGSYAGKREDSPLHQAANAAAREVVRVLLAKGADPNRKNREGETALFAAARANDVTSIKLLLARGAKNVVNRKNDRAADVAFAAAAFEAYSLLRKRFREADLESRFDQAVLNAEDARRLLARRRGSSFTAMAVSGEADPASRRVIASFKLRGNALEAATRASALAGLPQAVRSRLLEAIGEEAHRLASGAKIDIGSFSIGGAVPRFFPRSGLARAAEFAASFGRTRAAAAPAVAPGRRAPAASRAGRASRFQPDHLVERTEALLVHGWETRVDFDDIRAQLASLRAALAPARGAIFVAATDFPNGGQCIADVVIGWPAARVAAKDGPVAVTAKAIAAAARNPSLPARVHASLEPIILRPLARKPQFFVVPTGPLAGADLVFGTLVDRKRSDDDSKDVVFGCDMSQTTHKKGVRGERVAASYRWQVRPADLSPRADRARTRRCPGGKYYLIAGYY